MRAARDQIQSRAIMLLPHPLGGCNWRKRIALTVQNRQRHL